MKISTTTIAALLSIAGTTCGVNAEAMAALTNNASRVQAQERRRHLEDKCEEEFIALDTCFEADAVNCGGGVGDEGVRKLFGERRSEFSRSLSHGRHLDENTCDGYQLDACAAAGSYPDCACADEYLLAITCEANIEKELMCNLTYEVCDQVPALKNLEVFVCLVSLDSCPCVEEVTAVGVERRRHLEDSDGDFTCDFLEVFVCLVSLDSCPCVEEVTAVMLCQAELNGLDCAVPTQETCDSFACAACGDAAICFSGEGYCSYDQESKLWSGFYELCNGDENGSAADCAQCFPDAECSDICTACNAASPCFDNTGYCFYDEESQLWSGVFEDCNQGAASCAECYPDAE
eukprot:CAMPEP_0195277768 /NCGR_PEP_ID=MMETSP0706-20130129/19395_1 /TAXON_ID=33640 /ORGANISM="Asterionellopsis glacialis, Strain CCMP134" /LENGTH=347 /DNA_ID=CAMNT_0040335799 /DNA_START=165 /DNA_END=1206 /DNA_ORIENTATION=+